MRPWEREESSSPLPESPQWKTKGSLSSLVVRPSPNDEGEDGEDANVDIDDAKKEKSRTPTRRASRSQRLLEDSEYGISTGSLSPSHRQRTDHLPYHTGYDRHEGPGDGRPRYRDLKDGARSRDYSPPYGRGRGGRSFRDISPPYGRGRGGMSFRGISPPYRRGRGGMSFRDISPPYGRGRGFRNISPPYGRGRGGGRFRDHSPIDGYGGGVGRFREPAFGRGRGRGRYRDLSPTYSHEISRGRFQDIAPIYERERGEGKFLESSLPYERERGPIRHRDPSPAYEQLRSGGRYQNHSPPYGHEQDERPLRRRAYNDLGPELLSFRDESGTRNNPNIAPRAGDWICSNPLCGNLNFARRDYCNNCNKLRYGPGDGRPDIGPHREPSLDVPVAPLELVPRRGTSGYRSPSHGWARDGPGDHPPRLGGRFVGSPIQTGRADYRGDLGNRARGKLDKPLPREWDIEDRGHSKNDFGRERRGYDNEAWNQSKRVRSQSPRGLRAPKDYRRNSYIGRGRGDQPVMGSEEML